jgi:aldehyde dehydrogenase (NAD+)
VTSLLEKSEGHVIFGGLQDAIEAEKYVPPTLVADVKFEDSLMSEELFAPVLPLVPVEDLDEAIRLVNSRCVYNLLLIDAWR